MQFIIREAKKSDLIKISEIEKLSFDFGAWGIHFLTKFLDNKINRIIVAEADDIIGYCAFSIYDDIIHIKSIAVHPHYRNKGIGKALLKEVINFKKDIFLEVRVSNESAIKLYESLGFERILTLKRYYSNGEDAYRYFLKNKIP